MIDLHIATQTSGDTMARRHGKRHESSLFPAKTFARVACIVVAVVIAWQACKYTAHAIAPEEENAAIQTNAQQPRAVDKVVAPQTADHGDPFSVVLLELSVIIVLAMVGRWIAVRFDWPGVLGELASGMLVGNIGYWFGIPVFVLIMHLGSELPLIDEVWTGGQSVSEAAQTVFSDDELHDGGVGKQIVSAMTGPGRDRAVRVSVTLWLFSNLGVILLLFLVGLESSVDEMLEVGLRSSLIAVLGVVMPFILGLGTSIWLLPEGTMASHLFLGATLCATSVGITARVLRDLGRLKTPEARMILGAAVIDDVLGLVLLAVVIGIVQTGHVSTAEILRITLSSAAFLGGVILFGGRVVRVLSPAATVLDKPYSKLLFPLALAFFMSWLASVIKLASIVGAFAAGLIVNEAHFEDSEQRLTIMDLVRPLERIFAPIFFVLMGMQVNLKALCEPRTISLAAFLVMAAIVGKLLAGLGGGSSVDRMSIGIGMIPRGEVGLIFASIGKSLGVVTAPVFSAIVLMVMVTTLITPIALKKTLVRRVGSTRK